MLTPSALAITLRPEPDPPVTCCIVWRRVHERWDFFCRTPLAEAERIVEHDCIEMGLEHEDYQVRRG